MPNLDNWLKRGGMTLTWVKAHDRSAEVDFMSDHQGTAIVLLRGSSPLTAQTVRLAQLSQPKTQSEGNAGESGIAQIILIGLPTFDVQRGDRFVIGTARYEVILVDSSIPGRIEAHCEARQ